MAVTTVQTLTQTKEEQELEPPKEVKPFKRKIVWFNAIGFLLLHLAALYGISLLPTVKILTIIWGFLLAMMAGVSITGGAHRLWSHRSYKATKGFKLLLLIGQTMAGQNCLYIWVRDHRQHHKYSDTDGDPHNASRGFFFSHIGWLMCRKHPDVIALGKTIDMSDLEADPYVMFQKNHYKKLYFIFAFALPILIPYYLWGESLWNCFFTCYITRFVVGVNFTWMVNSYAHMFGTKPYTRGILPSDSDLVAFLAMGEGWHNYHHTFPWDYRAAELGSSWNLTTLVLDQAAKMGWVYDRKAATMEMIQRRVEKRGDGTHWKFGTKEEPHPDLKTSL